MDIKELKKQLKEAKANIEAYKASRQAASTGASPENKDFAKIEKAAVAKFGVKSLKDLVKINTAARSLKHIPLEQRESVKTLKEAVDVSLMCAKYFGKRVEKTVAYSELVVPALKAFGIDSGDAGFNWIPTMVSESYLDEYNLENKVAKLFTEIKMPSNPYSFPVLSNGAIATILGEAAAKSTKDTFTDSAITFTAKKLSNQYLLPEELQEDSAVDVMKVIRQELIEGQEKALEIAILEGDTTSTHMHTNTGIPGQSSTPAAGSPERAFDGLRVRAFKAAANALSVDAGAAVVNESHLRAARKLMGKYGTNPADLAIIVGPKAYNEMQDLDDVRTLEQYGPQAPVLTGELAKYEGIPVIVSEWLREDTDTTGINGASGNTKLSILIVNRKRFMVGLRRGVQVRVEPAPADLDSYHMVSYSRKAFQGVLNRTGGNPTESTCVLIFNIL